MAEAVPGMRLGAAAMTRAAATCLGLLLFLGVIITYWWVIVAAVVVVAAYRGLVEAQALEEAEAKARALRAVRMARRADEQHAWVLCGDERGTYGHGWVEL